MPRSLVPTLSIVVVMGWAALAAQSSPRTSPKAVIADVAWIAGTWIGGDGGVSSEERWTSPAGGAMLAVSRTVQGDRLVAFEYLRIVEQAGTLVYIAQPNGRPPVEFTLTHLEHELAVFENPAHDFPKKIRYSLTPDGLLVTEVSGAAGSRTITVTLKKQ